MSAVPTTTATTTTTTTTLKATSPVHTVVLASTPGEEKKMDDDVLDVTAAAKEQKSEDNADSSPLPQDSTAPTASAVEDRPDEEATENRGCNDSVTVRRVCELVLAVDQAEIDCLHWALVNVAVLSDDDDDDEATVSSDQKKSEGPSRERVPSVILCWKSPYRPQMPLMHHFPKTTRALLLQLNKDKPTIVYTAALSLAWPGEGGVWKRKGLPPPVTASLSNGRAGGVFAPLHDRIIRIPVKRCTLPTAAPVQTPALSNSDTHDPEATTRTSSEVALGDSSERKRSTTPPSKSSNSLNNSADDPETTETTKPVVIDLTVDAESRQNNTPSLETSDALSDETLSPNSQSLEGVLEAVEPNKTHGITTVKVTKNGSTQSPPSSPNPSKRSRKSSISSPRQSRKRSQKETFTQFVGFPVTIPWHMEGKEGTEPMHGVVISFLAVRRPDSCWMVEFEDGEKSEVTTNAVIEGIERSINEVSKSAAESMDAYFCCEKALLGKRVILKSRLSEKSGTVIERRGNTWVVELDTGKSIKETTLKKVLRAVEEEFNQAVASSRRKRHRT